MPNTKELRTRIRSVKNTSQITKAMQMVSATKMRRAQNQALAARPYNTTLAQALRLVADKIQDHAHPLLKPNEAKKLGAVLLSTDRGLCGSLNTNLFRAAQTMDVAKDDQVVFYSMGRKGRDFLARSAKNLSADFENLEKVAFRQAVQIRKVLVEAFLKGEIKDAYVIYPEFISTLRQEPKVLKLLPIDAESLMQEAAPEGDLQDFIFEPTVDDVLDFALTHYLDTRIYQALLETKASEHSARMIAMQNATNNAKELVNDLTLTYNQVRQSAITTQILEIASAGAALE